MLNLVLGTAGTGKTYYITQQTANAVKSGKKAILLVPEQFSFETEKSLFRLLGADGAINAEVLSFSRLADRIFREYGGLAGKYIDETGKYLLMSIAADEVKDSIELYSKHLASTAFIKNLTALSSELKASAVNPQTLINAKTGDDSLNGKINELGLILSAYDSLLKNDLRDEQDNLLRAAELVRGQSFFNDFIIMVDGFAAFMNAEYKMLECIIQTAPCVTVALCADCLYDGDGGMGVFSAPKKTAQRLIDIAHNNGVEVSEPVVMQNSYRFKNGELCHLQQNFLRPRPKKYSSKPQNIKVIEAQNIYGELEFAASEIKRLVMHESYKYSSFAVITRSLDNFETAVEDVFSKYEIPFFMDKREDVYSMPLTYFLLTSLEAVKTNFAADAVIRLAKSPVSGIDSGQAAEFENYCFVWDIKNQLFCSDFKNNPSGISEKIEEHQQAELDRINTVRRLVVNPLVKLKNSLEGCDGAGFANAVYNYLAETRSGENILSYSDGFEPHERKSILDMSDSLWNSVMDILNSFAVSLKGRMYSLGRLIDLFKMCVEGIEIGRLPQTLDQVIIGTADRIRPDRPSAVFVAGASDGEFPLAVSSGGILSESERLLLEQNGIQIGFSAQHKAALENYFAYFAVTSPSDYLYVSYSKSDLSGGSYMPSPIIQSVLKIFDTKPMPAESIEPQNAIVNIDTAISEFAKRINSDTPQNAAIMRLLCENGRQGIAERLLNADSGAEFKIENPNTAKALFGEKLRLSPTALEKYFSCPFAYFCKSGLKLKKRQKAQFSPVESGTVIHHVLQVVVSRHIGTDLFALSEQQIRDEIAQIIKEYLAARIQDADSLPARMKYLFTRLVNTLCKLVLQLIDELSQSEFSPVEYEMPIENGSQLAEPLTLKSKSGAEVSVVGTVDRVDIMTKNGKKYIRVIDYKSGQKRFDLSEVLSGINMQMLLYLFAIWQNGKGKLEHSFPAGVLYMPSSDSIVNAERNISQEKLAAEHRKHYRMNGLVLADFDIVRAMEKDAAGVFIPAKIKTKLNKNGEEEAAFDNSSSVATLEQLGRLKKHIESIIAQMADNLQNGEIPALPICSDNRLACGWCEYKAVCGYENEQSVNKRI
ncbi:MAG TPA: hypothetical protein DCP97_03510, partial [Ruminococcaceae bacterium]|nr:hypothetical protein [Oscillospiraceae bacterium]